LVGLTPQNSGQLFVKYFGLPAKARIYPDRGHSLSELLDKRMTWLGKMGNVGDNWRPLATPGGKKKKRDVTEKRGELFAGIRR